MTPTLQPGSALDARVAAACGIRGYIHKSGYFFRPEPIGFFRPSADDNDAFEAADKAGLWLQDGSPKKAGQIDIFTDGWVAVSISHPLPFYCVAQPNLKLALCEAVLTAARLKAAQTAAQNT